jgi:hypothetical protein
MAPEAAEPVSAASESNPWCLCDLGDKEFGRLGHARHP